MSRVTIADVARTAEVSTATVSNVLNGTGRVSESTRARVKAVAGALGYGPAGGGGRTLGLAVTAHGQSAWDFASVPYFARAISAATVAAHRRGYALMAMPAGPAEHRWRTLPASASTTRRTASAWPAAAAGSATSQTPGAAASRGSSSGFQVTR
ncbi:LacI family DNA-binding transcriptional regulator [Streptomyces malaysiensis]|uniref:LacI family DNA-binding transcriptional regulator n=1 Tax=Streptomyces malaysiensis TaxID=92644 RepID=UPI003717F1DF